MLFIPLNDPIPDFKCVSMKIRKWTNSMFRSLTVRRWWCELLLWWNVWTRFKQPKISMQNDSKSSSLFASHWNQLGQSIFPNKLLSSGSKVNPHIFLLKWNNQLNRRQFHSRVTTRSLWVKAITLPKPFHYDFNFQLPCWTSFSHTESHRHNHSLFDQILFFYWFIFPFSLFGLILLALDEIFLICPLTRHHFTFKFTFTLEL